MQGPESRYGKKPKANVRTLHRARLKLLTRVLPNDGFVPCRMMSILEVPGLMERGRGGSDGGGKGQRQAVNSETA